MAIVELAGRLRRRRRGTVLFCTLAGFAFAKLRFRGRDALFAVTIGTMMIPPSLGVVPLYTVMADARPGRRPRLGRVLPSLVTAFGVFFMRQYLARRCRTSCSKRPGWTAPPRCAPCCSVVLPIARPGHGRARDAHLHGGLERLLLAGHRAQLANPTVQVALNNLGSGYVPDQAVIMAGTLVGTLPVLVVFVLLGRQIVGGIIAGAVKG